MAPVPPPVPELHLVMHISEAEMIHERLMLLVQEPWVQAMLAVLEKALENAP